MPAFDRLNGEFIQTHCTAREKYIFKRAGWIRDSRRKVWYTTDIEKALAIRQYAVGAAREHLDNAYSIREVEVAASWAENTDEEFPSPAGLEYMPFQKAGIDYALYRDHTLFADPMGLGKTIQAIGVHNVRHANKVLIVCPASLKVNWAREWRRWDVHGLSIGIAMSIPRRKQENGVISAWTEYDFPDTDVVIVNYDMLETFDEQVKSIDWDILICDEAHLLKTPTAIRTMCVLGGKKKAVKRNGKIVTKAKSFEPIQSKCHLYLTGTPILSKPVELWTIVRSCDPRGLGRDWEKFVFRYCGATYDEMLNLQVDGRSNLEELNQLLRERFMVRRDKKSVLKELPDKTRELIVLPKDKLETPVRKELTRVEKALAEYEESIGLEDTNPFRYIDQLCDKLQKALDEQDYEEPNWEEAVKTLSEPEKVMFTEISAAREEVALAKVGLVVDHIAKLVQSEEPVICFGYHKSVIKAIRERLEKQGIRVCVITGEVSPNKRQAIVDAFQSGEYDVILGNIMAMGVGLTITRASFVVFAELDWVPSMLEQAEDRAWRHGQKNAVLVQYLVVDGSIEARMAIALLEKMGVIFMALDDRG